MNAEMIKLIMQDVPVERIADAAANQHAVADVFFCTVRDQFMPEIVVGHGLVVVAYGSEISIERIKQALIEVSKQAQ